MPNGLNMVVAGIDEVGRGCIAGAVVAAIVILDPENPIDGLADSKALSPKRRQALAGQIRDCSRAWALGRAEASEIDRINILEASMLAMRRAFLALPRKPEKVTVDGNRYPDLPCPGEAIVGGDALIAEISAASILAKVARDGEMQVLDALYPGYGFSIHKGYPTRLHQQKLRELGPSPVHRRSFATVRRWLDGTL